MPSVKSALLSLSLAVFLALAPQAQAADPLLSYVYSKSPRHTEFKRVTLKHLPAGSTVTVTCKGSTCPTALKNGPYTRHVAGSSVNLSAIVKGKLKPGTVLKFKASRVDWKLTVRRNRAPLVS
jgi:hypothetical protein